MKDFTKEKLRKRLEKVIGRQLKPREDINTETDALLLAQTAIEMVEEMQELLEEIIKANKLKLK